MFFFFYFIVNAICINATNCIFQEDPTQKYFSIATNCTTYTAGNTSEKCFNFYKECDIYGQNYPCYVYKSNCIMTIDNCGGTTNKCQGILEYNTQIIGNRLFLRNCKMFDSCSNSTQTTEQSTQQNPQTTSDVSTETVNSSTSTTVDVASSTTEDVTTSTTADAASSTTADVASSTTEDVITSTTADVASSTTEDVTTSATVDVASSTTADVASSTTEDMATSTTADVASSTTEDMATSTTADVASSTTEDMASSTTEDMATSTTADVASSTTEDMATSTTADVASSTTEDLATSATEDLATSTTENLATSTDINSSEAEAENPTSESGDISTESSPNVEESPSDAVESSADEEQNSPSDAGAALIINAELLMSKKLNQFLAESINPLLPDISDPNYSLCNFSKNDGECVVNSLSIRIYLPNVLPNENMNNGTTIGNGSCTISDYIPSGGQNKDYLYAVEGNANIHISDEGSDNFYFLPIGEELTLGANSPNAKFGVCLNSSISIKLENSTTNMNLKGNGKAKLISNINLSTITIQNAIVASNDKILIVSENNKTNIVIKTVTLYEQGQFSSENTTLYVNTLVLKQGSKPKVNNFKVNSHVTFEFRSGLDLSENQEERLISNSQIEIYFDQDSTTSRSTLFSGNQCQPPLRIYFSAKPVILEGEVSDYVIANFSNDFSSCESWRKVVDLEGTNYKYTKCTKNTLVLTNEVDVVLPKKPILGGGEIAGIVIACVVVVAVIVGIVIFISKRKNDSLGISSAEINSENDSIAV